MSQVHLSMFRKQPRDNRKDQGPGATYLCPMHPDVRGTKPGKCPKCGMNLVPEGTRFALLQHMVSSPSHLVIMAALMVAAMAAAMMMMR
jgi:Heavy metal binding domain